MDKFNWWNIIRKRINPQYKCEGNDIFQKGYKLMTQNLNMFQILQNQNKLMAAVEILTGNDKSKIEQIRQQYLSNQTLILEEETQLTSFKKFMQQDQRINKEKLKISQVTKKPPEPKLWGQLRECNHGVFTSSKCIRHSGLKRKHFL